MTARAGARVARRRPSSKTAGERLIRELSRPGDSYSITVLIERAGQTADWLTRLDGVLNGDHREWMCLKIGTETPGGQAFVCVRRIARTGWGRYVRVGALESPIRTGVGAF